MVTAHLGNGIKEVVWGCRCCLDCNQNRRRMGMMNWDFQFRATSRRMLKWTCKTRSKEALKINSHPSLLWPNTLHLLRWWYIICFLSERRTYFPWLMPAHSRTSALYTHAAFEQWRGRGMKSKPYRNVWLKTGAVWLLLMLLQLLPCSTTEGPVFQGWQQAKEWCIMMIMMLVHMCIHAANPNLFDLWLAQTRTYILRQLGKNGLWENYAHCSAWKCFMFLNIFIQWEEPDSWRPKIQSCHCFFKGRCMQSPMFIVTSKCQLYLKEIWKKNVRLFVWVFLWKVKTEAIVWIKPPSSLGWSDLNRFLSGTILFAVENIVKYVFFFPWKYIFIERNFFVF